VWCTAGTTTSVASVHIYAEPDELAISDDVPYHHHHHQQQQQQLDPANITIDAVLQRGMELTSHCVTYKGAEYCDERVCVCVCLFVCKFFAYLMEPRVPILPCMLP